MGKDPDEIRQEIERTRQHMGDTVEALSYKTDVKERTKDWVQDKTEGLRTATDRVKSKVSDAAPSKEELSEGTRRAVSIAESNPLGLAVGGIAVGFLIGLAAPKTKIEDRKLGPMADQVKQQAAHLGQEAVERGKVVAQEVAESAASTAKQEGQRQAQALKESAQESTSNLTQRPV
jgi:gas vesicle protein